MSKTAKHPLAIWREAQNPTVTQKAFALMIGYGQWMVASVETGSRRPGRDMIMAIAKATDGTVTFEQLAGWTPEPKPEAQNVEQVA